MAPVDKDIAGIANIHAELMTPEKARVGGRSY